MNSAYKFKYNDVVIVQQGFYKGESGYIVGVDNHELSDSTVFTSETELRYLVSIFYGREYFRESNLNLNG